MRRIVVCFALVGFLTGGMVVADSAKAEPLSDVIRVIRESGGRYVSAGASLAGADCSGLVSVAQSLAMGQPIRRLGSTRTLLAGSWPYAIRGASPSDRFVIGVNRSHMVASIDGVGIEATTSGEPFKIGAEATSPWAPQFVQYRIDPAVLT